MGRNFKWFDVDCFKGEVHDCSRREEREEVGLLRKLNLSMFMWAYEGCEMEACIKSNVILRQLILVIHSCSPIITAGLAFRRKKL
jgi:hypothetical protein